MKRRPLSLSERFGSMTQQIGGGKESNVTGDTKKTSIPGPSDKRSSNEGRSRETKENINEHGYVTRNNLTVQVTKASNSEVNSNNNSKYDRQIPAIESKEHNRHHSQGQSFDTSAHSQMHSYNIHGNPSHNEHYPIQNEQVAQSRNDSSPKYGSGVNKVFHSNQYNKQHFNNQNESRSRSNSSDGKWTRPENNDNYGNKNASQHGYNKNSYQRQSYKGTRGRGNGNRGRGDPRQQRNQGRNYKYPQSPGKSYPKSPSATYSKSPGATFSKSPGATYSKSPSATYSKSPGATYSKSPSATYSKSPGATYHKSPHFENPRVNQFEFATNEHQNDSSNLYSGADNHHVNYLPNTRHNNPHTPPSPKPVADTNHGNPSISKLRISPQVQQSSAFKHSQSIGSGEQPLDAYNHPLSPRYINYKGSARIRSSSGESLTRQHTGPHYKTSPSFHNPEVSSRENLQNGDNPYSIVNQHGQIPPEGIVYENRNGIPNVGIPSYPPPSFNNLNVLPTGGGFRQRHFSEGHIPIPSEIIHPVHPVQRQNSFGPPLDRHMFHEEVPSGNVNCFPQDLSGNTDVHNAQPGVHHYEQELHMTKPNFKSFDNQPEFNSELLIPDMTYRNFSSPEAQQPTRAQRHEQVAQQNVYADNSNNINVQNEQDELVNTLLQQCQAMVKNNHDKQALNKVVSIIQQETSKQKSKMLDCNEDTQQIKMPNTGTKQVVTPASILDKLCSSEARFSPANPSPSDKTDNSLAGMKFEGRTLLKGGVAPRHIPKNYVEKIHKEKPEDPRFTFPNYLKSNKINIPLPPWAADIYGMDTVRRLETMYKFKTEDVPLPVWASDYPSVKPVNEGKQDVCNNSDTMMPVDMEIEDTNDGAIVVSNDRPKNTGEQIDTSVLDVEGRIEALVKSVREESDGQQGMLRQKPSPKFTFKNSENKPVQVVIGSAKKDQTKPWEKSVSSERCKTLDNYDKSPNDFDKTLQPYDRRRNDKSLQLHDNKRHDVVTYKDRTYEIEHEDSGVCRKYEVVSTKTVIIEKGHGRSRSDSRSRSHERIRDSYDSRSDYDRHGRDSYRYRRSPSPLPLHYKSRHRHLSESDKSRDSMYHDRCYNDFSPCKKRKLKKELALEYGGDIIYTPDKDGYASSDTRE